MGNESLNRLKLQEIKLKMNVGIFTYEEAKKEATPVIKKMNERATEIAKEYGMRPKKFTFAALMR